jgi:hypothetical protein
VRNSSATWLLMNRLLPASLSSAGHGKVLPKLNAKFGHRRVLARTTPRRRRRLTSVVEAHCDALVSQQDLQIFYSRTIRLQIFMSKSVTQTVGPEAGSFEACTPGDPFDQLAGAVHGQWVVAPLAVRATTEEKRFGSHPGGALIDQVLEDRALGLRVNLDTPVLIALAAHRDRTGHVFALDNVGKAQAADFTAANARIEEQERNIAVSRSGLASWRPARSTIRRTSATPKPRWAGSFACFSFHIRKGLSSMYPRSSAQLRSALTPRNHVATDCLLLPPACSHPAYAVR